MPLPRTQRHPRKKIRRFHSDAAFAFVVVGISRSLQRLGFSRTKLNPCIIEGCISLLISGKPQGNIVVRYKITAPNTVLSKQEQLGRISPLQRTKIIAGSTTGASRQGN